MDELTELEHFILKRIIPMLYRRAAIWRKRGMVQEQRSYLRAAQGVKDELNLWRRAQGRAARGSK